MSLRQVSCGSAREVRIVVGGSVCVHVQKRRSKFRFENVHPQLVHVNFILNSTIKPEFSVVLSLRRGLPLFCIVRGVSLILCEGTS